VVRGANREFLAPSEPDRPDSFHSVEGQRAWIEGHENAFAILDGDEIAGTISISNVVYGFFRSANVGYWVARDRTRKGLATAAVAAIAAVAFDELELHRLEAGTLVGTSRPSASSRRTGSSGSASRAATS
jgi:ribosomal-protein-alanine N-acetyltransferase